MKLGVITDCFKTNLEESIRLASELGLNGVQIYATTGEFSPDTLTIEKKTFYKNLLIEKGLTVSALCADMGGHGFEIEKDNKIRVEKTKRIIDLANEFGAKVITTHVGVIPKDKNELIDCIREKIKKEGVGTKEKHLNLLVDMTDCGIIL